MLGKQCCIILILATLVVSVGAVEYKRERYNVIVERSPFGENLIIAPETALDEKAEAEAMKLASQMEKEIRLCYLLETEAGEVRAGFENLKAQAGDPRSIMLMVGENFNGMKLIEVDILASTATLELNGKPVSFELKNATPAPAKEAAVPPRKFGSGFRRRQPPKEVKKPKEPELTPEEVAERRKEVRARLENYQMEAIRQGMPPLPVPLTEEMDAQLVEEGILPPQQQE